MNISHSSFNRRALLSLLLSAWVAAAQSQQPTPIEEQSRAMGRAAAAVVGLRIQTVPDAPSAATLGSQRRGSGIVIGDDGTVLTIGYLILEAEQIVLHTDDGRQVPARPVAYDVATGFGLVQALTPLKLGAAPLGDTAEIGPGETLMAASGGEDGSLASVRLVSRRAFSGYWEYHIEGALFTFPPHDEHSGAGLFNSRGQLVGVGSLRVADARGPGAPRIPGNMFVPVDLLKPILAQLRSEGRSAASKRAWLGLNCVEVEGALRVARVSPDSPADAAGLQVGDRILAIDGTEVATLATLWQRLWSGGQAEREVTLDVSSRGERKQVKLQAVDRMTTLKRAAGV